MEKVKRILALTGVIIIAVLYIITLVLAIANNEWTAKFFQASLFATFIVPIFMYLMMWLWKLTQTRKP